MVSELQARRTATGRRRRFATTDATGRRRFRGDDGTALVEAAFVTPVFLVFVLGLLDYGLLLKDYLALNYTSNMAGRSAAIAGNKADADYQVLQAVARASAAIPRATVQRVVVFRAGGDTDVLDATCAGGTASTTESSGALPWASHKCNVYTSANLVSTYPSSTFGCGIAALDRFWCPTSRKYATTGANGPPDWIGVYVEVRYQFATRLFGNTRTLKSTSILRIEPTAVQ